ncbi:MAG TPA: peptidylprolyl isomerase [Bacteroidales bacterium]|nr:peptidylprolyl isomerase [Bacteroidales bacterium]
MNSLKGKLLLPALLLLISIASYGQVRNEEVLMTIAGKQIQVGEFLNIYHKNNVKGESIDKKSLDEYLDLFINFKLKVRQAEEMGLDTLASFRNELNGYREQLAKPYFIDEPTLDKLINEAYEREKMDLRASHIFFKLSPDATPADTLAAYQKALLVRDKLMKGMSFEEAAVEFSEDPSAKDREATPQHAFLKGNKGDLGFFTVFDMVYSFENGAWNTETGKVSVPVRTEYGYHLIKVTARRPALGKMTVAHIFMSIPKSATAEDSLKVKLRIDSVYQKLQAGGVFEDLVKTYSDDKGSAAKGGVLPTFGVNRMVPEFVEAIYALPELGAYTKPILTSYGWHIVKLIDRKTQRPFEEEKGELKQRIMKDSRGDQTRQVILAKIRKEYGVTEFPEALKPFYTMVNDSIFLGKWKAAAGEMNSPLFKVGNLVIVQKEFADHLVSTQRKQEKQDIRAYVDKKYTDFVDESLIKWENSQLEIKYPEFRALMGEYRDGILLFDLTDQKVWSKAVKDTVGLEAFYQKNKNNYRWDTRCEASIFTVKDAKVVQKVKNFAKSGLADNDILKEVNTDSTKIVTIESAKFSRHDNKLIDSIPWTPGFSGNVVSNGTTTFVYIRNILKPEVKQLSEARGLITADYQNYLEKEWIATLRAKYPVDVKRDILARIK